MEEPKVDASQASEIDAVKPEAPRFPGNVDDHVARRPRRGRCQGRAAKPGSSGKRRVGAMAAVVALATVAGALGGALATARIRADGRDAPPGICPGVGKDSALEASVARIDADIVALKASLEHTSKTTTGQFNKTSDRLDKVEKAQAEPAAKLAKLSEAVDKLRAAAGVAQRRPPPRRSREETSQARYAPATAARRTGGRRPSPRLPGCRRSKAGCCATSLNGGALIESRRGVCEVYAGDPIPGLGRVDAIRKQDGRWVVVTSKGLIVAR